MKVKLKLLAEYNGHSIKPNKSVDFGFKCSYDQLPKYVQVVQLLNENTELFVKLSKDDPTISLGTFMLKDFRISHDGEGQIKFNSQIDFVEVDNLNKLAGTEIFMIKLQSDLEDIEDEDSEESESDV